MTHEELNAIKQRAEQATKGPWVYEDNYEEVRREDQEIICAFSSDNIPFFNDNTERDAEFVAHAREDIPRLVEKVEYVERLLYYSNEYSTKTDFYKFEDKHDEVYDYLADRGIFERMREE